MYIIGNFIETKLDLSLPGTGEKMNRVAAKSTGLLLGWWNVLKLDSGDSCTALNILKITRLYSKTIILIFYELYLN